MRRRQSVRGKIEGERGCITERQTGGRLGAAAHEHAERAVYVYLSVLLAKLIFMEVSGVGNAEDDEREYDRERDAAPFEPTGQQGSQ